MGYEAYEKYKQEERLPKDLAGYITRSDRFVCMFVRQLRAHYEERRRRAEAEGHSREGVIFVVTLACDSLIGDLEDYIARQRYSKSTGPAKIVNSEADRREAEVVVKKATQSDELTSRVVRELYKHYQDRGHLAKRKRDEVHLLRIFLAWVELVAAIERNDNYVDIDELRKSYDL